MLYICQNYTFLITIMEWLVLKDPNIKGRMLKTEGLVKKSRIYEAYKNTVMPHGRHIYANSSAMTKTKMCSYPHSDHALPHWKRVLKCCAKCPCVNITDQEKDDQYSDTSTSIRFHIYHIIPRFTTHGRLPLNHRKICRMCKQDSASQYPTKIYTIKELVTMETKISNFHTSF